jgi:hypothetical protein
MSALGEKSFCVLKYQTSKSVFIAQREIRAKYAKDPPTNMKNRALFKQLQQ